MINCATGKWGWTSLSMLQNVSLDGDEKHGFNFKKVLKGDNHIILNKTL